MEIIADIFLILLFVVTLLIGACIAGANNRENKKNRLSDKIIDIDKSFEGKPNVNK